MSLIWNIMISNLYITTFCQQYIFVDEAISSLDADAECLSRYGTHLASIHNVADNTEAQSLCKSQPTDETRGCWIGLHTDHANTPFKWYDGTSFDYQNWNTDEPNEYYQHVQEEYLVSILTDTGQWNDEAIGKRLRLICWNSIKPNPSYEHIESIPWTHDTHIISMLIALVIVILVICIIIVMMNWCFSRHKCSLYKESMDSEDDEGNMDIVRITSLHANKAYQRQMRLSQTGTTLPSLPPDRMSHQSREYECDTDTVDGPDDECDTLSITSLHVHVIDDYQNKLQLQTCLSGSTLPSLPPERAPRELIKRQYSKATVKSNSTPLTDITTTYDSRTQHAIDNESVTYTITVDREDGSVWKSHVTGDLLNVPN